MRYRGTVLGATRPKRGTREQISSRSGDQVSNLRLLLRSLIAPRGPRPLAATPPTRPALPAAKGRQRGPGSSPGPHAVLQIGLRPTRSILALGVKTPHVNAQPDPKLGRRKFPRECAALGFHPKQGASIAGSSVRKRYRCCQLTTSTPCDWTAQGNGGTRVGRRKRDQGVIVDYREGTSRRDG